MTGIEKLIKSIVTNLKDKFIDLKTCEALAGFLETTTHQHIITTTPGIYIANVGSGGIKTVPSGEIDIKLYMVAYLMVYNKTNSQKREHTVQKLLNDLLIYISDSQYWSLNNTFAAKSVESMDFHGLSKGHQSSPSEWRTGFPVMAWASDLYGEGSPIDNLALWAITWEQRIRIGDNVYSEEIIGFPPKKPSITENIKSMS